ncbi:hypothetical protein ACFWYW_48830 [Nonomuraea sp. NPDC059023]|uniref:hypothetical protein n=1 Tax=unclassified Nonomuraea TaxID=2593643 RepID=UPI00367976AA
MLDTAVKDVPAIDRPLVRAALEHGLRSGATALLLDSLDETHDRRGTVVSEIENLCGGISADVPVLLATRDVAYAQAATLGWDELRLVKPKEPKRAVRAVLAAVAAARQAPDSDAWVERRVEWVAAILDRDRVLGETALMPVLLALLAGDRSNGALPVTRAEILHGVVKAAVRRREAHRDPGVRLATLNEHDSANATLAAFAVEAGVLGDAGGQARLATVQEAVATALIRDWGLPSGAAASSARAVVHFWDEIGVFVIRGADEIIAPRMELFLDIGDAVQASKRPPEAVAAWVDVRIRDRRHEPLILAAAMSDIACEKLLTAACDSGEHELLIAASTAVRQHARISDEGRVRLAAALTKDAASPDRHGWTSYVAMLGLVSEYDTLRHTGEVLAQYPLEHQVIAKAAMALRVSSDSADNEALLNTLRTNRLRQLPDRDLTATSGVPWTLGDDLYDEVIEAVARRLLSHVDEATGLIVEMLQNASIGLRKRLLSALRGAGFDDEVNDILTQEARNLKRTLEWLKDHDWEGEARVLDYLAHLSCAAELDVAQAARLDELAVLITSLRLDDLSAWPRREAYSAWLEFVDVILTLGGFDLARISAEAAIMQRRVAQCGIRAFTALDIASERRRLVRWHTIDTPEVAARSLAKALFMGRATSFVAAAALSAAPPDIAVPLLEDALPRLESLRDNQHFAALALSLLQHDEPLREWAVSDQVELRRVAAMRLPNAVNGELNSLLCQLTHDKDNRVADAAVRNVGDVRTEAAVEHLKSIASTEHGKWTCLHCGSPHADIVDCMAPHIALPNPAQTAHDILAEFADSS